MADGSDLKIVVALTEKDLYKANVSVVQRKRSIPFRILSVIAFAISIAVLFYFGMLRSSPDYPWRKAAVLGTCLGLALQLFFWPFQWALVHGLAYYAAWSLVRSKPAVLEPTTYKFSPTGASYSGPTSTGRMEWRTYLKIRETSDQFLLYVQKRLANVLPKRAFQSAAELHFFRQLVRQNFSGETEFFKER